jgi:N-acetyl-anhydromuramyl-L-alanine amidase AmpD
MEKKMIIDALQKLGSYLVSRPRKKDIKMIVVHATGGGSFSGAWETLKLRGLGYHAILPDEDDWGHGDVIKCVPDSRYCFHAGNSYGPEEAAEGISRRQNSSGEFIAKTSVNDYTLGISFVNNDNGRDPYSAKQHQACVDRCVQWALAYPSIAWISTHYYVSPRRKTDPMGYDILKLVADVNLKLVGKRSPVKLWKP